MSSFPGINQIHSWLPFFRLHRQKRSNNNHEWWEPTVDELNAEAQRQWFYMLKGSPRLKKLLTSKPPVIIGGVGGSCTRLVAQILKETNDFGLLFSSTKTLDSYSNRYSALNDVQLILKFLRETDGLHYDPASLSPEINHMIENGLTELINLISSEGRSLPNWGWKEPKIIYWLPALANKIPEFKFVHVVRDVRSISQFHFQELPEMYENLFGRKAPEDSRQRFEEVWAKTNLEVFSWANKFLKSRYHRVRAEDLTGTDKTTHIEKLLTFAGIKTTGELTRQLSSFALPLKPFKKEPRSNIVKEALEAFGYSCD